MDRVTSEFHWKTYGPRSVGSWVEDLDCSRRVKNAMGREIRRIQELVDRGKWFDKAETPISPKELADLRSDLNLWETSPADVLVLLEKYPFFVGLGKKGAIEARESLRRMLNGNQVERSDT